MIFSVDLVYYTEENVPECGKTVFVQSNEDITKIPTHLLKENIFIEEAMEANDCKGIGCVFEISEEEFKEEYPDEEVIALDY